MAWAAVETPENVPDTGGLFRVTVTLSTPLVNPLSAASFCAAVVRSFVGAVLVRPSSISRNAPIAARVCRRLQTAPLPLHISDVYRQPCESECYNDHQRVNQNRETALTPVPRSIYSSHGHQSSGKVIAPTHAIQ